MYDVGIRAFQASKYVDWRNMQFWCESIALGNSRYMTVVRTLGPMFCASMTKTFFVPVLCSSPKTLCCRLMASHQSKSRTCTAHTHTHQIQQIRFVEGCKMTFATHTHRHITTVSMDFHSLVMHAPWMEILRSHLCMSAIMPLVFCYSFKMVALRCAAPRY